MTGEALLSVEDLSIAFPAVTGRVQAVRDVSMSIMKSEILGLVGESGCGKSTLGYALMGDFDGAKVEAAGSIRFQGTEILRADTATLRRIRGKRIAMVHQNPGGALTPTLRIGPQLIEILIVHDGITAEAAKERVIELLAKVNLPDPEAIMQRYPHELSGGQQQRIVIAAALLGNPDLLILDEPTTGLDVTVEAVVLDLLRDLRDQTGVAMLLIAHNLGVIARICERVGVMYAGELVEMAGVRDLFHKPQHPYTINLLRCIPRIDRPLPRLALQPIPGMLPSPYETAAKCLFASRCEFSEAACFKTRPKWEKAPKRAIRCLRWKAIAAGEAVASGDRRPAGMDGARKRLQSEPAAELLTARDLSVSYRSRSPSGGGPMTVVDRVALTLHEGAITAIVGESGSGKTTLGRALVGLTPLNHGTLSLRGSDISGPVGKRPGFVHRLLQMVFQDHAGTLNPALSVRSIIARPLRLFGIATVAGKVDEVKSLLAAVGLDPVVAARRAAALSGGQKQRVAIARAFAGRPDVVVCDEITSALDVSVQASVLNFLLTLQEKSGTSLLFISHDLGVVRYIADEILVMYLGRICERGSADAVFAGPNHPYTAALMSAVPVPDPDDRRQHIRLEGVIPSIAQRPTGCPFHTRCPHKIGPVCETEQPPVREPQPGHRIECHHDLKSLAEFQRPVGKTPAMAGRRRG